MDCRLDIGGGELRQRVVRQWIEHVSLVRLQPVRRRQPGRDKLRLETGRMTALRFRRIGLPRRVVRHARRLLVCLGAGAATLRLILAAR